MTSLKNVTTRRHCNGTASKKSNYSSWTGTQCRRHVRTTIHRLRAQWLRMYRLKRVTIFLRFYRSTKRRRESEEKWVGDGPGSGDALGTSSDCRQTDGETDAPEHPVFQWSPSENEKIFVSHCDEDLDRARDLVFWLESRGLSCILPWRDFKPGPVVSHNAAAVMSSRWVIPLLSHNYLQSFECMFEMQMSVCEMYSNQRALVVPVLVDLEEKLVPRCLRTLSLVNMRDDPGYEEKLMSILKGPDIHVTALMPAGNVSQGLAWAYYLRYLQIILPDLKERIDNWCKKVCIDVRMPRKLYILVPASCNCPDRLKCVKNRIQFSGHLDPVRRTSAGSVDRSYDLSVWTLTTADGQVVQFVGEYPAIVDTLYLMETQRTAGLDAQLKSQERDRFRDILEQALHDNGWAHRAQLVFFHDMDKKGDVTPLSDILLPLVERDRV